ncbi:hypothetical protein EQH57_1057, partial [Dictyocoela roeselum]
EYYEVNWTKHRFLWHAACNCTPNGESSIKYDSLPYIREPAFYPVIEITSNTDAVQFTNPAFLRNLVEGFLKVKINEVNRRFHVVKLNVVLEKNSRLVGHEGLRPEPR